MDTPGPGSPERPEAPPPHPVYAPGAPLGGAVSAPPDDQPRSDARELLLSAVLFGAALAAGAATLLPWRDFGRRFGGTVRATGWVSVDGSAARGWVVVLLAVGLAVAGILLAAGRVRRGRILASASGAGLVLAAVAEWGLGVGDVRSGPGPGLWAITAIGLGVIVAVGVLEGVPPTQRAPSTIPGP